MIKRRQHIDIAGASKVIDGAVIALDGEIARIDTKQSDLSSRIRVLERELHRSTEIKTQLENSNKEFVLRKQQQIANNKGGGFDEGKWLCRTSDGQAYASNAKQIAVREAEISARINEWELIEQQIAVLGAQKGEKSEEKEWRLKELDHPRMQPQNVKKVKMRKGLIPTRCSRMFETFTKIMMFAAYVFTSVMLFKKFNEKVASFAVTGLTIIGAFMLRQKKQAQEPQTRAPMTPLRQQVDFSQAASGTKHRDGLGARRVEDGLRGMAL